MVKLSMLVEYQKLCEQEKASDLTELPAELKLGFEQKYPFEYLARWGKQEALLKECVATRRLGKHGLRPCGLRHRSMYQSSSGQGARLSAVPLGTATMRRPLAEVYERMKTWLKQEREHQHEHVHEHEYACKQT